MFSIGTEGGTDHTTLKWIWSGADAAAGPAAGSSVVSISTQQRHKPRITTTSSCKTVFFLLLV